MAPSSDLLYDTLLATACAYINSTYYDLSKGVLFDRSKIEQIISPEYKHSWGHNDYVSKVPRMKPTSSPLSHAEFLEHLRDPSAVIESMTTTINDTTVDTKRKKVVCRVSYWIKAKGVEDNETEENDLVWIFQMNEDGTRIVEGVEFVDGDWNGRLEAKIRLGQERLAAK